MLADAGHRVVVTGSAGERRIAAEVARLAGLPARAVLAGRTGLRELAALVAHARLLISGDTGIAHLAVAHAVPTVTLFGPVPPRRWGPPAHPRHIALWYGPEGDPHGRRPDPALLRITPDDVLDALGRLPAARRPGEEGAP